MDRTNTKEIVFHGVMPTYVSQGFAGAYLGSKINFLQLETFVSDARIPWHRFLVCCESLTTSDL